MWSPRPQGARGQVPPTRWELNVCVGVGPWPAPSSPGEEDRLRRPGRAPGTIPSCIISVNTARWSPHPSLRPLGGEGVASPHPTFLYLPLRHRYCKLAGLNCGQGRPRSLRPYGVKGLGPVHPKKKPSVGAREEKGSPGATAGKELTLQRSPPTPHPLPGQAFMVSALSPPWVGIGGGHFGKGRTPGESKGLLREPPHSLTEVPHQDGPVARAPSPWALFKGKRGSGHDFMNSEWPGWCGGVEPPTYPLPAHVLSPTSGAGNLSSLPHHSPLPWKPPLES